MIFKHCAAVEKFTYFCMSTVPKWNAWLSSSSSRGWVHRQQWVTQLPRAPLPASSWARVVWGHTFKCHYFWRELGCLKCDSYLRKYGNWLSWVLWPIWLWCSCAFPSARSHSLVTEFSTFHPCFELTEISLFSETGELLLSPCLLQKKAKQVFILRGLLEGRISEKADRKGSN